MHHWVAMNARLSLAALVAAAGTLLSPTSARADAAGASESFGCFVLLGGTYEGFSLPSNAPALLVVDRSTSGLTATLDATLVSGETRTSLGMPAKDRHELLTLPLSSPAVGKHVVEVAVTCSTQPEGEQKLEVPFTVTEAVALPKTVGALSLAPKDRPTPSDMLRLELSEGMRAFQAAAKFELVVDGIKANEQYGPAPGGTRELYLNSGAVCVEDGALHREKRTVEVTVSAVIAGVADSPAPAKLDVTVDCGSIEWTEGTTPGEEPPPSSTPPGGEGSSSASGCSAAPKGAKSPVAIVALALVGLAAMRRRRRA